MTTISATPNKTGCIDPEDFYHTVKNDPDRVVCYCQGAFVSEALICLSLHCCFVLVFVLCGFVVVCCRCLIVMVVIVC